MKKNKNKIILIIIKEYSIKNIKESLFDKKLKVK